MLIALHSSAFYINFKHHDDNNYSSLLHEGITLDTVTTTKFWSFQVFYIAVLLVFFTSNGSVGVHDINVEIPFSSHLLPYYHISANKLCVRHTRKER